MGNEAPTRNEEIELLDLDTLFMMHISLTPVPMCHLFTTLTSILLLTRFVECGSEKKRRKIKTHQARLCFGFHHENLLLIRINEGKKG